MLPLTGIEHTPLQNLASKVVGLQMHPTISGQNTGFHFKHSLFMLSHYFSFLFPFVMWAFSTVFAKVWVPDIFVHVKCAHIRVK